MTLQSTTYCPSCGAPTRSANSCTKCQNNNVDGKFCGECGGPSFRTALQQGGFPKVPSQPEVRKQNSRPNEVKVDTTSILAQGITPSAVFKGVKGGGDNETLSKYRIKDTDAEATANIDWNKTIKNASRAAVDEPNEVWAQKSPEPKVNVSNQQSYSKPANVGPLPSEQLRRDDYVRIPPPSITSPITRPPPSQPVTSPKTGNVPPPPGPSRTVYTPPPQPSNPYRSIGITVEESTIRPSILKDTSDPLERFRIKDPPADSTPQNPEAAVPKLTDSGSDLLQKYRVKSPEEEQMSWHFYFSGFPTDPGKPVELKCDGDLVFENEGVNGLVNTHICYLALRETTAVGLTVKSINYTLNKNLEISKGRFVKFAMEKGALKFRQQKTEIED